jgi:hypothetical protein
MDGFMTRDGDRGLLRWGGLAGVAGGLLLLLVFVIVGAFVPAYAADPAMAVRFFPEVSTVRLVENGLYLVVLVLWVASFVAIERAAGSGPSSARAGSALGIAGLVVLAVGALPHVAIAPLSAAYHAADATAADQATLGAAWQAIQGLLDASLVAGLAVLSAGLVALGAAMSASPAYGRRLGAFAVAMGVIGVAASVVAMVDPASATPALGMIALIAFHLVAGWRTISLSRAGRGLEARAADPGSAAARRPAVGRAG